MNIILAIFASTFVYCMVQLIIGFRKNQEERVVKRRLNAIRKIRRYDVTDKNAVNKGWRLNLSWIKIPASVERDLKTSGIKVTPQELVAIWGMVVFFPPLLLLLSGANLLICIGAPLIGALVPPLFVKIARKRRVEKFQNQLGEALLIFGSTIRAGVTFERAMITVADGLPEPICEEFSQTGYEMRNGTPVETAMDALADRMQSEDLRLVTSAVLIQKRVGGNLADILDNISGTIKDRISIKRNVKTLTSQGRISAQVIGALPVALMFIISGLTPGYMDPLFDTFLGHVMLGFAIFLECIGFFIMLKMTDIKY